jgi:IstB-like ATP binding protein
MADFEWAWPSKIERNVIERALTLDFIPEARNLILVGRNGLGKTMIAQNICYAAVLAGYSVLFRSAPALLDDLQRQGPEGRRSKLRTYANAGLVCVDEVGYLSFDDKAADLLYEVINRRYERKSVILTNMPVECTIASNSCPLCRRGLLRNARSNPSALSLIVISFGRGILSVDRERSKAPNYITIEPNFFVIQTMP